MTDSSTQRVSIEKKYCPKCYQQFEGAIAICPEDQTVLRGPHNDPLIGKVFADRYDVQSVLGLGGMSVVYRGKHRLMDRIVAIKMLHSKLKEDVVALERFKLEAQAASSLSHQNIISVYDFGVTPDGEPYFVMDCLEGESLKELIDRKSKVPFERALPIFRQICDGLDAAHRKGIVHRDMKPANVVLIKQDDGSEIVKLVDFGIAKLLPGSGKAAQHLTQTGEVFGSPIYMSPEQCLGKELDTRSDIYALGCLMYETLSGEPPLLGDSFLQTMNMHVSVQPRPFKESAPDANIPSQLEQLIFRCMSKDPAARYQHASEIRDQISAMTVQLLGDTSKQRGYMSGAVPPAVCVRKTRAWTAVACIFGVALAGFMAVLFLYEGAPEDRGTPFNKMMWQFAITQLYNATASGDYQSAQNAATKAIALARGFGDGKTRLEKTLQSEADLYQKWEGHAEQLEKVNNEIAELQAARVKKELADRLQTLQQLAAPTNSAVGETNMKLNGEAQIPGFMATASKLSGRGMFDQEESLLEKAIEVETKLLGSDAQSLAQLLTKLAECRIALHKFNEVRPLLIQARDLRCKNCEEHPVDYVHALNKLGQFDLDQSNLKDAEPELKSALTEARKLKGHRDLLLSTMRSYADLCHQSHREAESAALLKEADALESSQN